MLRILSVLLILSSCSMGAIQSGGDKPYVYDVRSEYNSTDLQELSSQIVVTSKRDPRVGKLDDLFGKGQKPLKRVGIVVFESQLQTTLEGLARGNMIYMSEQGKQIMTENLLRIWEQSEGILFPELDYVSTHKIKKSPSFHQYGLAEDDYVKSNRTTLSADDIFFTDFGKKTTTTTTVNPRGMRDMSFMLVPAYDLMGGPKWSEHNKSFLNDVVKELKLDAAIIVKSEIEWTAAHKDKFKDDFVPEQAIIKIKASTLLPLSQYNERLKNLKVNETPDVTLCYRSYEAEIKVPVFISVPEESKNFDTIEQNLLSPVMKTYKDLSQMTLIRITEDLKKTW
jgi:hypothetical protein